LGRRWWCPRTRSGAAAPRGDSSSSA
jgi:hypothetical protein